MNINQWLIKCAFLFILLLGAGCATDGNQRGHARLHFQPNDRIAFVGGTDVVEAQFTGHLETLLAVASKNLNVRFRNFGWEGDTVHSQPREIGFPSLETLLQREKISLIVLEFGRMESLQGVSALPKFVAAYEKLLDTCSARTSRLILVTPPPFEKCEAPLPNLFARNAELNQYAQAIRKLGRERNLPVVDLFAEFENASSRNLRLTSNGLQLTTAGQARVAETFARQLGFKKLARRPGRVDENGAWPNRHHEQLRRMVVAKNRLWFDYWRPQNWAFLGGDRVEQLSSRDHRNPAIRWFPEEMKNFVPLIETKEREIFELANRFP